MRFAFKCKYCGYIYTINTLSSVNKMCPQCKKHSLERYKKGDVNDAY